MDQLSKPVFEFAGFRLDVGRQLLLAPDGLPIALASRTFDTLRYLVERAGELVERRELMRAVWPKTVVEENNLNQCIVAIRKTLGEDHGQRRFILTVPGRGYKFTEPVRLVPPETSPEPPLAPPRPARHRLGRWLTLGTAAAVVLAAAAFGIWRWRVMHTSLAPPPSIDAVIALAGKAGSVPAKSIVVLPFLDMSERKDEGFFADGMTEEITSILSQAPDLQVSARTSAYYFKDRPLPVGQIGRLLGVANVLEGSVRNSGDRLRITVQLVSADNGYHLWAASYDRKLDDLFAVQSEIAQAVVRQLQASLEDSSLHHHSLSSNPRARNLFLHALTLVLNQTRAGLQQALADLREATTVDPNFAEAWALLAVAHLYTAVFDDAPASSVRPLATDAAERALALDPKLSIAHTVMARLLMADAKFSEALAQLREALGADPNDVAALAMLAALEQASGHDEEAVRLAREVISRDPIDAINHESLGNLLIFAGHFQEAIESFQSAIALNPSGNYYRFELAVAQLMAGDPRAALQNVELGNDEEEREILRPVMLDALGQHAEAERQQAVAERKYAATNPHDLAAFYAMRGDADHAMSLLERSFNQDFPQTMLRADPLFNKLHGDPRFQALIRRIPHPDPAN
jgi:TolB-like protein/DNA-binding winged helix-turn-helix (wHTH) protein/Flp pilus assembly protein TadD